MIKEILQGKPVKHPLHPLVVHFPIGLFFLSFALDIASYAFPESGLVAASFYCIALGILAALVAAVPGFVDYNEIRTDHPAKRTATYHMVLNLAAVGLYGANLGLRSTALGTASTPLFPFLLSVGGVVILSVSGYLGGDMIYNHGIGVGRHRRQSALPVETIRAKLDGALRSEGELKFVPVAEARHLKEGESMRVEVGGNVLAIFRLEGELFACQEFCTHRFGPLSEGSVHGRNVMCPWHGSCFDMANGEVKQGPAKVNLKTYPVQVEEGKIVVGIFDF